MKLVRAIREGRILPYKPPAEREREAEEQEEVHFDLWQNEEPQAPNPLHIPAPKLPPPGYDLSYNPPEEYLPYVHLDFIHRTPSLTPALGQRRSARNGRMQTRRTGRNCTSQQSTTLCGRCQPGVHWSTRGSSGAWYVPRLKAWLWLHNADSERTGPVPGASCPEKQTQYRSQLASPEATLAF